MKSLLLSSFCFFSCVLIHAQIPEGYLLQYQQNFNDNKALTEFTFHNTPAWGIFKVGNSFLLQGISENVTNGYIQSSAILNNKIFGDFILEADIMTVADSSGIAEVGLFLGYKDSTRFYYIQLANRCDSINHGIFLMKNGVMNRLTECAYPSVHIQDKKWHKIRLERDIVRRTIRVFLDKASEPVLSVKDYEIVMGSVGFGNMSGSIRVDNIKIWSQTVQEEWYK